MSAGRVGWGAPLAALTAAALTAALARGQEGLEAAPREARAFVARAIEAMGGRARLASLQAAILQSDSGKIVERHTLRLPSREMHYASRRSSGAGFDVVLSKQGAFICDRTRRGNATYVEDLSEGDSGEGAYERDMLFLPLLLSQVLGDPESRLDYRGDNSEGDPIVRAAVRTPDGTPGRPFWIRLRFDKRSGLLVQSMGLIPVGADEGKKRFLGYLDYRELNGVQVPARISDQRGELDPREYPVSWEIDPELPADLFARPKPE